MIILCHDSFTLKHFNQNNRLVVFIRRKDLGFLIWNSSTTINQLCHYTSQQFQFPEKVELHQRQPHQRRLPLEIKFLLVQPHRRQRLHQD
mmetsp:Transcript_23395/g.34805  ORF Transcript_23395/g.34805 Transcript_23395/m.34805 type:complete len:90 (+) Transcript_23395:517-786(+)